MKQYRNQIIIGIGFMALVLVISVLIADINTLINNLGNFPVWWFALFFVAKCINWVLRYFEWQYFLHVINVQTVWKGETRPATDKQPATIRAQDSFTLWITGLPLAVSPGKMAEVLKSLILKNMTYTPVVHSAPVILAERLVDGIAIAIMVGFPMLFASDIVLSSEDLDRGYIEFVTAGTILFMLLLIVILQSRTVSLKLLEIIQYIPVLRRFQPTLVELYESSFQISRIRHLIPTTTLGLFAYGLDCIAVYMMVVGLGEPASFDLFIQSMFILSVAGIIGAISALPGGAGARELTIGGLSIAIIGMDAETATTLAILVSLFQLWLGVIVGIITGVLFRNRLFPEALKEELTEFNQQNAPA